MAIIRGTWLYREIFINSFILFFLILLIVWRNFIWILLQSPLYTYRHGKWSSSGFPIGNTQMKSINFLFMVHGSWTKNSTDSLFIQLYSNYLISLILNLIKNDKDKPKARRFKISKWNSLNCRYFDYLYVYASESFYFFFFGLYSFAWELSLFFSEFITSCER